MAVAVQQPPAVVVCSICSSWMAVLCVCVFQGERARESESLCACVLLLLCVFVHITFCTDRNGHVSPNISSLHSCIHGGGGGSSSSCCCGNGGLRICADVLGMRPVRG